MHPITTSASHACQCQCQSWLPESTYLKLGRHHIIKPNSKIKLKLSWLLKKFNEIALWGGLEVRKGSQTQVAKLQALLQKRAKVQKISVFCCKESNVGLVTCHFAAWRLTGVWNERGGIIPHVFYPQGGAKLNSADAATMSGKDHC